MDPKQHILNAAQAVFARHGFRQTAMSMVADEAGLSRQALYHHFASKEALFAALVAQLHEAALGAVREAARRPAASASAAIAHVMISHHRTLAARLAGSPFAAELVEESSRQCGALAVQFARRLDKELEALCVRLVREVRLQLRPGIGTRDLVEMVTIAAKGVKATHAGESEAKYARALERMINVICAGVEAPRESRGGQERIRGRIAK